MPRACSICSHPERAAIDEALVEGTALRDIPRRFPGLSKDAAARHKTEHLPATLASAAAANEIARGDTLLDKVRALEAQARDIAGRANMAGDLRTALAAVRELTRIVELQAKLAGDLIDAPTVSVTLGADWTEMRATILSSLDEYPEARVAVARALANGAPDA
jgi:hypothetical protein